MHNTTPINHYRWSLIALVMAMFIWAGSFVALKISFQSLHPAQVIFSRMFIASVCFLLMWRWIPAIQYQAGDWKYLFGMVLMEPCLYFIFEAMALQHTTASQAGVITSLLPLLVAIGAIFTLKEKMNATMWLGFSVAMVGAMLLSVTGESSETAPNPALGNFFELIAMACAAVFTLLIKHLVTRYSVLFLTAFQSWVGAIFFLGPALYFPLPEQLSGDALVAIVYLGLFVSMGAYGLHNYAISNIPATQASAFINLIPVFTIAIAFVVLNERLTVYQLMACGLVVLGLVINRRASSHQPETVK